MLDAVDWAVEQGYADPDRVAICGGSYGGYSAPAGATFTPGVPEQEADMLARWSNDVRARGVEVKYRSSPGPSPGRGPADGDSVDRPLLRGITLGAPVTHRPRHTYAHPHPHPERQARPVRPREPAHPRGSPR
ncbi:prolyl oligopeptidase family serine peptidase [Streptomyces sp. NPDC046939]|uniref:alpha/beta hydrolase family protein n=1 Tax=Streptomyces sp. NPDC046939 TaxID=3155376 RepID=UPI0033E462AB